MNKWDKIFTKGTKYKQLNEIFLDNLLAKIEKITNHKPKTVIDLGCGTGDSIIKFVKRKLDVTGVDFSKIAIKKTEDELKKNKIESVKLINADLNNINISTKVDIIFCKLAYTFIKDKDEFLKSVKNMMHLNSIFVLITPVLHKELRYNKDDKPGIAVDFGATKKLLANNFSKIKIFHHEYFGNRGEVVTFLAVK